MATVDEIKNLVNTSDIFQKNPATVQRFSEAIGMQSVINELSQISLQDIQSNLAGFATAIGDIGQEIVQFGSPKSSLLTLFGAGTRSKAFEEVTGTPLTPEQIKVQNLSIAPLSAPSEPAPLSASAPTLTGATQAAPTPGIAAPNTITDPTIFQLRQGETLEQYYSRINQARGFTPQQTAGLPLPTASVPPPINPATDPRFSLAADANKAAENIINTISDSDVLTRSRQDIFDKVSAVPAPPRVPSLVELFNSKRAELGIDVLESRLAMFDSQLEQMRLASLVSSRETADELLSVAEIARKQSATERRIAEKIAFKQLERDSVARQLDNKYSVLSTITSLTNQDFQNASTQYNQEYNRAIQLYNLITDERDQLKNDARANLQTIINTAVGANKSISDFDDATKALVRKLEAQAGLPVGFFEQISFDQNQTSKIQTVSTRTTSDGLEVFDVLFVDPTGSPYVKSYDRGFTSIGDVSGVSGGTFEVGGVKISSNTASVLNGVSSLSTLTPSIRQVVESDLNKLEIYSTTPPQWFRNRMEQELQQSLLPKTLQDFWDEFKKILFTKSEQVTSGDSTEISDEEFLRQLKQGL